MSKADKFIQEVNIERVHSKSLFRRIASEAIRVQREETKANAAEIMKQMCPSRSSRGCASVTHKHETNSTKCDGNCSRIKYFLNGLRRFEL